MALVCGLNIGLSIVLSTRDLTIQPTLVESLVIWKHQINFKFIYLVKAEAKLLMSWNCYSEMPNKKSLNLVNFFLLLFIGEGVVKYYKQACMWYKEHEGLTQQDLSGRKPEYVTCQPCDFSRHTYHIEASVSSPGNSSTWESYKVWFQHLRDWHLSIM